MSGRASATSATGSDLLIKKKPCGQAADHRTTSVGLYAYNGDISMVGGKSLQILRIMSQDHATSEADCSGDDHGIDRHLASSSAIREKVPGDSSNPNPCRDDPSETLTEYAIDRFVKALAAVELDQDR